MNKRTNQKFSADEVEWLLLVARGGDHTEIPLQHKWIARMAPIEARDELLFRFQRLVTTLVNVCLTGRPDNWSSYQKTFLRMLGGNSEETAAKLKRDLADFHKTELFSTGQLAVLQAIETSRGNLAATIVIRFRDLIEELIQKVETTPIDSLPMDCQAKDELKDIVDNICFQDFLSNLSEGDWIIASKLMDGEPVKNVPDSLKEAMKDYLDAKNSSIC